MGTLSSSTTTSSSSTSTSSSSSTSSASPYHTQIRIVPTFRSVSSSNHKQQQQQQPQAQQTSRKELWIDAPPVSAMRRGRPEIVDLQNEIWIDGPKAVGFQPQKQQQQQQQSKFSNLRLVRPSTNVASSVDSHSAFNNKGNTNNSKKAITLHETTNFEPLHKCECEYS